MDLKQLIYFNTIAEEGSITAVSYTHLLDISSGIIIPFLYLFVNPPKQFIYTNIKWRTFPVIM